MKITRIEIKDFCGVRELEWSVPPGGGVIKGKNGGGKTSILRAIRAALAGQGVDGSAIRNGADKSEIMIDLEAVGRVRRSITHNGSGLTVTTPDGDRWAKPQHRLNEILGTSAI